MIFFNTASVSPSPILAVALSDYNLPPLFESQGQERFESSRVHYQTRKISVSDTVHSRCLDLTSMKVCLDTGKMLTIPESPCLGGLFFTCLDPRLAARIITSISALSSQGALVQCSRVVCPCVVPWFFSVTVLKVCPAGARPGGCRGFWYGV